MYVMLIIASCDCFIFTIEIVCVYRQTDIHSANINILQFLKPPGLFNFTPEGFERRRDDEDGEEGESGFVRDFIPGVFDGEGDKEDGS